MEIATFHILSSPSPLFAAFLICLTIFLHVKILVKTICCKLDYLSKSCMAIPSYDLPNPFPCCYQSQNWTFDHNPNVATVTKSDKKWQPKKCKHYILASVACGTVPQFAAPQGPAISWVSLSCFKSQITHRHWKAMRDGSISSSSPVGLYWAPATDSLCQGTFSRKSKIKKMSIGVTTTRSFNCFESSLEIGHRVQQCCQLQWEKLI
jgi:hypothetical protein